MGTYNHKQVLKDYATGKLTPEMAVGHSLQHIELLYEAQQREETLCRRLQRRIDELEHALGVLQTAVTHHTHHDSN